jgi:hypothetical protein
MENEECHHLDVPSCMLASNLSYTADPAAAQRHASPGCSVQAFSQQQGVGSDSQTPLNPLTP